MALSASFRVMKATKARFEVRPRSSSVRGHIIFTLAKGPYLQNSLQSISSFICIDRKCKTDTHLLIPLRSRRLYLWAYAVDVEVSGDRHC